jgi:SAM-dependent methyltransferase
MTRELIRATAGPRILELGARRVGVDETLREILEIPHDLPHSYRGVDLYPGPGVDVVGDAHRLGALLPLGSIDFVVSKSVFEHLAMPWKVILEINDVLREGGYLFINTVHTFPLHELPWDFFRFSDRAWAGMVNRVTGFEIVATEMNSPCTVVPSVPIAGWQRDHPAFINSNLLARKVGPWDRQRVRWEVDPAATIPGLYPSPRGRGL